MWKIQQSFQPQAPRDLIFEIRRPLQRKTTVADNENLRKCFKDFFEKQYSLPANTLPEYKNEQQKLKSNLAEIFVSPIEFKGLESLNNFADADQRNPERLKNTLTILEIYFEEHQKLLTLNSQKTHSYFDFLDHAKSLSFDYYETEIEVKQDIEYLLAFKDLLSKKAKLIKAIHEYLGSSNSLGLVVERVDKGRLQQLAENSAKLSLFEVTSAKGSFIRPGENRD